GGVGAGSAGTDRGGGLLGGTGRGGVGGVILFGGNIASAAAARSLVSRLQAAAAAGGNPPLLVAVDQEGGPVRRLPDGPPADAPAQMRNPARAGAEGAATGSFLKRIGIDVDLAPVVDTPPPAGNFLGTRAFGSDPKRNAALGAAFVRGLQRQGVAATAKHFPGLGTAGANTDVAHVWIRTPKPALDARLAPFAAAVRAGVDLVMVSNAGYRAYDASGLPAVLSRPIVTGLLRWKLGFDGVVISDAMEAPGPQRATRPRTRQRSPPASTCSSTRASQAARRRTTSCSAPHARASCHSPRSVPRTTASRRSSGGLVDGEGGIRTLEAGISPPNALAGRRLQPLGHFSGRDGW